MSHLGGGGGGGGVKEQGRVGGVEKGRRRGVSPSAGVRRPWSGSVAEELPRERKSGWRGSVHSPML